MDLYQAIQKSVAQLQSNITNNAIKQAIAQLPTLGQTDIIAHHNQMIDVLRYMVYPWGVLSYYKKAKILMGKLRDVREKLINLNTLLT